MKHSQCIPFGSALIFNRSASFFRSSAQPFTSSCRAAIRSSPGSEYFLVSLWFLYSTTELKIFSILEKIKNLIVYRRIKNVEQNAAMKSPEINNQEIPPAGSKRKMPNRIKKAVKIINDYVKQYGKTTS